MVNLLPSFPPQILRVILEILKFQCENESINFEKFYHPTANCKHHSNSTGVCEVPQLESTCIVGASYEMKNHNSVFHHLPSVCPK